MKKVVLCALVAGMVVIASLYLTTRMSNHLAKTDAKPGASIQLPGLNALTFVPNQGQWDPAVAYVARRSGEAVYLEKDAITIKKEFHQDKAVKGVTLRLSFENTSNLAVMRGEDEQKANYNFFLGKDRTKWRTQVKGYSRVIYDELYEGIDLCVREEKGSLEYDLLLQPGADLSRVVIGCEGVEGLNIDPDGNLIMTTALGEVLQEPPATWCVLESGEKMPVECAFHKIDDHSYGFAVAAQDQDLALVIDPGLEWSTYHGGNDYESVFGTRLNSTGQIIVTGFTESTDFPRTAGAYDTTYNGGPNDGFVSCISPDGGHLIWSTYIGGSSNEIFFCLAVDDSDRVTIGGLSKSPDYPVTPYAFDTTFNDSFDAVVTRLNPNGTGLVYSTYLGGVRQDWVQAIDIYANYDVVIGGYTGSANFPVTSGAYDTSFNYNQDVFVARLDADGSDLVFSTYLGGFSWEGWGYMYPYPENMNILVLTRDNVNNIYVMGNTMSNNFPTISGAYDTTFNGGFDIFVSCLTVTGSNLMYSTYLGGNGEDDPGQIVRDQTGCICVSGLTYSTNFPTTPGAFDSINHGQCDAFFAKFSPILSDLFYSTLIGGNSWDWAMDMTIDASGDFLATGLTTGGFPCTHRAYDSTYNGGQDAFVCRLAPGGNGMADLLYSSYLGGNGYDWGNDAQLVNDSTIIIVGCTASPNFPMLGSGYDPTYGGLGDGFICQFSPYVGIEESQARTPQAEMSLSPVFPNPCRGRFSYTLNLAQADNIRVSVFDASGRLVQTLVDKPMPAGVHDLSWQPGKDLANGIYYLRLDADGVAQAQKFVIVK